LKCTTGVALAFGEVVMGPLFKHIGHVKLQLILATAGLCVFGGIMSLGNEHRENLAIAVG
jgi:hypothetical protein